MRSQFTLAAAVVLGIVVSTIPAIAEEQPVMPGDPFPAFSLQNLNEAEGSAPQLDLAPYLGKKPIVLVYWIPRLDRSDRMMTDIQKIADEMGDKLAVIGVVVQRPGRNAEFIRLRIRELGLTIPVVDDRGYKIGQQVMVRSVPHLTIIDKEGRLQLSNVATLSQVLEYKMDVAKAIRRVAETGSLVTYGYLGTYYPVTELEGKPCPDFTAASIAGGPERSLRDMLASDKVNVLIFWSVDCPHCRKSLPEISQWHTENPEGINILTAAAVMNEVSLTKTKEFCDYNKLGFTTLVDRDAMIGNDFEITSTPTILIIGPDGVVDQVILSSETDFAKAIEAKKRKLLPTAGS